MHINLIQPYNHTCVYNIRNTYLYNEQLNGLSGAQLDSRLTLSSTIKARDNTYAGWPCLVSCFGPFSMDILMGCRWTFSGIIMDIFRAISMDMFHGILIVCNRNFMGLSMNLMGLMIYWDFTNNNGLQ